MDGDDVEKKKNINCVVLFFFSSPTLRLPHRWRNILLVIKLNKNIQSLREKERGRERESN